MIQWLRLYTLNARGLGSIPGKETRSHMLQLRSGTAKLKKIHTHTHTHTHTHCIRHYFLNYEISWAYGVLFNLVPKRVPYSSSSPFCRTSSMSLCGCIISTLLLPKNNVHLFNVTFGPDHSSEQL